ncbi:MAG TPA: outer membrane beta-barrel protein, partial [Puia sp.]|nr:outer membrane beta-barrel protein [Puia sp.]
APAPVTSGLTARPSISPKPGTDRSTTLAAATHNISTTTSSRNTPATGSNPHRVNRTKGHPAVRSTAEGQSDDLIAAAPGTANAAPGNSTTEPATQDGLVTSATGTPGNSTVAANHTITSGAGRQPFQFNPAIANLNSSAAPIQARKLATKSAVAIKTLQSPHRPWEAAFAGGIGVSSLHQVQISNVTLNNAVNSYSNATTSNTVTYNAARPSKQYVSTVKPGVSFWAGVLAHKPLSDRWGLSLGLNLSYYSTRVRIGEQVNNYTPSTSTLLTSSAVAPIQSYPYYNTGNDQAYTNRYYFLELPVAAEWRINRSHLLPLFWDGGLSLSYLMGSSAVYYNTKSGVYFKDGGVANHTQINISTALMVGLPIRGLRVQLGPQVQYGLTPLLNTELSGQQHIFYGGLRLVVYPGKK